MLGVPLPDVNYTATTSFMRVNSDRYNVLNIITWVQNYCWDALRCRHKSFVEHFEGRLCHPVRGYRLQSLSRLLQ